MTSELMSEYESVMSKSNAFETALLDLFFLGTAIADLAQNDTTGPSTALAVSLHTSDPGDAGTQATNETTYGGYARVTVARTGAGWVRNGSTMSPAATISFPACTSGSATVTHFGIGTNATAGQAGFLMYKGIVTPSLSVTVGVAPRLTTASAIQED